MSGSVKFGSDDLALKLDECVRCGSCKSVCPTYRALQRETASPRGKATLVKGYIEGMIGLSKGYMEHIKACALCSACYEACPNGVNIPEIILEARGDFIKKKGRGILGSLKAYGLTAPESIQNRAFKMASSLQSLLFKDTSFNGSGAASGLIGPRMLPLVGSGRVVPRVQGTSFIDDHRAATKGDEGVKKKGGGTVSFFAGCGVNYLMPEVGRGTIYSLSAVGFKVSVPEGQRCCGAPAYAAGDRETALKVAISNLEVLEGVETQYITTSCATCTHILRSVYPKLLREAEEGGGLTGLAERGEALGKRVKDVTELLGMRTEKIPECCYDNCGEICIDEVMKDRPRPKCTLKYGMTVTYHDPCHHSRYEGIKDDARNIIRAKGLNLVEGSDPTACCGLGGGLAFTDYGLSMEITKRKVEDIKGTGAEVVLTSCPGCISQLRDGLHRYGVDVKVMHISELESQRKGGKR